MHLRFLSVAAVFCAISATSFAQTVPDVKLPPSPPGQAAVQLGGRWEKTAEGGQRYRDGKWVVVDYSRPLLRGRADIFGGGADYGKTIKDGSPVWRAGANDTTRLTTQAPLQIGDKTLPPGVYNVFVDLEPGNWTLVLNTQPVQEKYDPNEKVKLYGSYNYDSTFDVMRVPMTVKATDSSVEQFTIGFVNVTPSGATLSMAWDKTMATADLKLAAGSK
jgi:Protein of unknown function (DUF2911)